MPYTKNNNIDAAKHEDVIIFAVKSQIMKTICHLLKEQVNIINKLF